MRARKALERQNKRSPTTYFQLRGLWQRSLIPQLSPSRNGGDILAISREYVGLIYAPT